MNISRKLENVGIHVFFPDDRKPKNVHAAFIGNNKTLSFTPFISADLSYINFVAEDPPVGVLMKLEWEW